MKMTEQMSWGNMETEILEIKDLEYNVNKVKMPVFRVYKLKEEKD